MHALGSFIWQWGGKGRSSHVTNFGFVESVLVQGLRAHRKRHCLLYTGLLMKDDRREVKKEEKALKGCGMGLDPHGSSDAVGFSPG